MKLFGWPLGEAIPTGTWPGWWAGLIELVTGVLITVGLFTRIAAFIASGHMAVAYFWMHWPPLEGPGASFWPYEQSMGGNGGEAAIMYCFAFLLIAGMGAGAMVDRRPPPNRCRPHRARRRGYRHRGARRLCGDRPVAGGISAGSGGSAPLRKAFLAAALALALTTSMLPQVISPAQA